MSTARIGIQLRTRKDMVALLTEIGVEHPGEHSGNMWNTLAEGCNVSWNLGKAQVRLRYVTTHGTAVVVDVEYL